MPYPSKITNEKKSDHNFLYTSDRQNKNVPVKIVNPLVNAFSTEISLIFYCLFQIFRPLRKPFRDVSFVNAQWILWISSRSNLGFLEPKSWVSNMQHNKTRLILHLIQSSQLCILVFCSCSWKPGIVLYLKGLIVLFPWFTKDDKSKTAYVNRVTLPDGFFPIYMSQISFFF